jgi:hypothetical protein
MNQRIVRHKQPTLKGGRRHAFIWLAEPTLFYRLEGLAQVRGVSVASLLASGARNELAKAQEGKQDGQAQ